MVCSFFFNVVPILVFSFLVTQIGRNMHTHVHNRIMAELQGACIGRNGYVITIFELDADGITTGLVDLDTGALNVTGTSKQTHKYTHTYTVSILPSCCA